MAREVNETGCRDTTEGLEARIMVLKKRLNAEEERGEGLLKASAHTVTAEENLQKHGGIDGTAFPVK